MYGRVHRIKNPVIPSKGFLIGELLRMGKNSYMINLKRLMGIGKDKGYITYKELN